MNISEEIFGEMRHLTTEENKNKRDMYRNMSVPVDSNSYSLDALIYALSVGDRSCVNALKESEQKNDKL
ncbi:MAG: hypothetical protein U0O22_01350 [Acutalibacteraceae bacterium]